MQKSSKMKMMNDTKGIRNPGRRNMRDQLQGRTYYYSHEHVPLINNKDKQDTYVAYLKKYVVPFLPGEKK